MYRITIAVLLSTAIGCSTSRSATGGLAAREGNGTVAGIITLANEVTPRTGDFCEGVTVKVTPSGAPEDTLGDRMVKVSRSRCSYQVAHLPTDAELQLAVTPSAAWRCDNGATPTLAPEPRALTLRDYETLTRDFRVSCPAPEAAPATP
jgi:hypothetical protein